MFSLNVYVCLFSHLQTMNACSNYIFICISKFQKHFIPKNDFKDFRLYISLCIVQNVSLFTFSIFTWNHSTRHPCVYKSYWYTQYVGIEMQDNYIAVHFQRSFHDMGGGRKSAVKFSSSSSSARLCNRSFRIMIL